MNKLNMMMRTINNEIVNISFIVMRKASAKRYR